MSGSADRLALLLLGTHLGLPADRGEALRLLSPAEQALVAGQVGGETFEGIGDLLGMSASGVASHLQCEPALAERIAALLARGGQFSIELEHLQSLGVWAATRLDPEYPPLLRERLLAKAPIAIFGAGPIELLRLAGVGLVGSRDLDPQGAAFAREVGTVAAQQGLALVSGGAKGADREATLAALAEHGSAVTVPADSLLRMMRDRELAAYVREGRLTLITPFHPAAGFDVRRAMARNKIVYCLSAAVYIASSGVESGGTWAGAVEALKARWVPVFVRDSPSAPAGNRELVRLGAAPVTIDQVRDGRPLVGDNPVAGAATPTSQPPADDIAWSVVETYLEAWRTPADVANEFGVSETVARRRLTEAMDRGVVTCRNNRYRASHQAMLPVFNDGI